MGINPFDFVLENNSFVSLERFFNNLRARPFSRNGETKSWVNGERVVTGSELCWQRPDVGEGIVHVGGDRKGGSENDEKCGDDYNFENWEMFLGFEQHCGLVYGDSFGKPKWSDEQLQRSESGGEIPVSQVNELIKTGQMDKWTKGQKVVTVFTLLSCSFSRNGGKHHEFALMKMITNVHKSWVGSAIGSWPVWVNSGKEKKYKN